MGVLVYFSDLRKKFEEVQNKAQKIRITKKATSLVSSLVKKKRSYLKKEQKLDQ